jgi:hypothetical protein
VSVSSSTLKCQELKNFSGGLGEIRIGCTQCECKGWIFDSVTSREYECESCRGQGYRRKDCPDAQTVLFFCVTGKKVCRICFGRTAANKVAHSHHLDIAAKEHFKLESETTDEESVPRRHLPLPEFCEYMYWAENRWLQAMVEQELSRKTYEEQLQGQLIIRAVPGLYYSHEYSHRKRKYLETEPSRVPAAVPTTTS